jgi:repressor of nif and glnA expression
MIDMSKIHHCDVCDKAMTIADMGYLGKPIISKKNPKYSKGERGIQTLCHLHYDEVLIKQGRHPNHL